MLFDGALNWLIFYLWQVWDYWSHWLKKEKTHLHKPCALFYDSKKTKEGALLSLHLETLFSVLIPLLVLPTSSGLNCTFMCLMLFLVSFYRNTANRGENSVFLGSPASRHIIIYFFLADLALFVHSCPPTAHYFRQATDASVCKGAPFLDLTLN